MSVVLEGKVLRFDQAKGYGFIAQQRGGEDVFLHVNDLLDDKHLVRPGSSVTFVLENSDRGLKASSVQLLDPPGLPASTDEHLRAALPSAVRSRLEPPTSTPVPDVGQDDMVDVVTAHELRQELTEILLAIEPALGADQIRMIREKVGALCERHGWAEA